MPDNRPRNKRPRNRSGKGRLAERAALERHHRSVLSLQQVLQPEAEAMKASSSPEVVEHIRARATELAEQRAPADVDAIVDATLDEIFGLGPLEPLLQDSTVRRIRLEGVDLFADDAPAVGFRDPAHARGVFDRILNAVGKTLEQAEVTATMLDGSTVDVRSDGTSLWAEIVRP